MVTIEVKSMPLNIELIKKASLLGPVPDDALRMHLSRGDFRIVRHERGSVLHLEGEQCTKLELILTGEIVVNHISESGDLLTVAEFLSGDILGGNILFSENPFYPWTIATRSAAVVVEIRKDVVFRLCAENPLFLQGFLQHLSDHTNILGDRIKYYAKQSIRESVLNYLRQEKQRQGTNIIRLTTTKKELAEKFGVERTSLSRELAKMRDEGLILFDRHTITLL